MSEPNKDIELIERFLKNELSELELEECNSRLENDLVFQELYENEKSIFDAVQLREHNQLKDFLKRSEENGTSTKLDSPNKNFYWLKIAASLVFILASLFLINNFKTPDKNYLFADYFKPYPNDLVTLERSANPEANPSQQAFSLYQANQFGAASKAFENLSGDFDQNEIKFYQSICQLAEGDTKSSNVILNQLQAIPDFKYKDVIHWYQALAFIKLGDFAKARNHLNAHIESGSSFQSTSAKELLNKLPNN